jgi:hypothetical protein
MWIMAPETSKTQRDRQPSACGASSVGLQPRPAGRPIKPDFSSPEWSKDGGKFTTAEALTADG